ncbi:MAG TPA: tripartite tricarboxylate transporter substrate-binding protein [Vineibacter sp.]|nr:tripartite tricarboxylate transporter substrate-binding protein [Vineibacter sp.]
MSKPMVWLIAALGLALAAPVQAQPYPDRPVRIVVGFPPGGGLDVLVRGVAQELTTRWGKSVVVDNRPGASSLIAAENVVNAAPDGYTLLAVTDQIFLSNRFTFKKLPYDPQTSFAAITLMARTEQFVLAHPDVPATTLAELVALDKRKPSGLAYGTWGDGSPAHLVYETLNKKAGTAFLGVAYKGVAPVLTALTANEVQLTVGSSGVAGQLLRANKVKALAFAGPARSTEFTDVPTTTEAGFPDIQAFIWFGLVAPAGTPAAIIDRISADTRDVLRQPAVAQRLVSSLGWRLVASTPAEMEATIRNELPIIRDMIANAGVKPQ